MNGSSLSVFISRGKKASSSGTQQHFWAAFRTAERWPALIVLRVTKGAELHNQEVVPVPLCLIVCVSPLLSISIHWALCQHKGSQMVSPKQRCIIDVDYNEARVVFEHVSANIWRKEDADVVNYFSLILQSDCISHILNVGFVLIPHV